MTNYKKWVDGALFEMTDEEQSEIDLMRINVESKANHYKVKRKTRYLNELGSIEDQLDMIYWDKINGTTLWYDKITEIKNNIPKT